MESTTLTESSIVVAAEHQTSTEVDGESIILDLEEGVYYGLNPVGARIWSEIQEPTAVEEVTAAITAEYDIDSEQCHRDVISLLQDLEENDLIKIEK
ncbi:PqqD family protein [Salinibacter altiplanensis]|uniref:PqqD family protein n=1 Tax=Salinibacter altiplanensis TaxID=1803181 RepID=UPI000C9FE84C|nr:PqqD family protein [Salinibacter altiplanensis]